MTLHNMAQTLTGSLQKGIKLILQASLQNQAYTTNITIEKNTACGPVTTTETVDEYHTMNTFDY